jgi:MFS family permease
MRRYLELMRLPDVKALLATAWIARLPFGINILALILLLRAEGISYAGVGVVTGTLGLAIGATVPLLGRLIDRVGQTRVLVVTAGVALLANVGLALGALGGASVLALTVLAALAGGSYPPVSPSLRALWPRLAAPEQLDTAFTFDALQLEVVFIVGPLLAAGIAAWTSPQTAFLTGVAMQVGGALAFAAVPASRRWRPSPRKDGRGRSALSAPGLRVLVATLAIGGIALGALEIGIPAFAEQEASRGDSGWLFALWGVGSLAGGLWYGGRRWKLPAYRRFLIVSVVLAVGLAPLPLATSMPVFAVLLVVAGVGLAPSTAAGYSLVGELAPQGALTEAYAWQIVGYVAGGAAGAWLAGIVVDELGVTAALAAAPLAAVAGLLVALAGRRSLAPLVQADAAT